MSGWGYHWTPCPGGGRSWAALGGVLAAVAAAAWVFANLAWIIAVVAACAVLAPVLALVVVPRLAARRDRRDAALWAQRPAQLRAEPARELPRQERPAIGPVYNFNFYGPAGDTHAAVIRKAIEGGGDHELGQYGGPPHMGIPLLHPDHRD